MPKSKMHFFFKKVGLIRVARSNAKSQKNENYDSKQKLT
jgi:hypothetical protein